MAVKQFPADFADITAQTSVKVFGAKADGSPGYFLIPFQVVNGNMKTLAKLSIGRSDFYGPNLLQVGELNGAGLDIAVYKTANFKGMVIESIDKVGSNHDINLFTELGEIKLFTGTQNRFHVFNNGNINIANNLTVVGTVTPGSDIRLKTKIRLLKDGALNLINKLKPVSYTLRSDNANSLGFIADDIREIFPELIVESQTEEKMLTMNYMGLTAPIVKAMQEMSATIEELKAEIAELKSK